MPENRRWDGHREADQRSATDGLDTVLVGYAATTPKLISSLLIYLLVSDFLSVLAKHIILLTLTWFNLFSKVDDVGLRLR